MRKYELGETVFYQGIETKVRRYFEVEGTWWYWLIHYYRPVEEKELSK
jgi:hypothetical protein